MQKRGIALNNFKRIKEMEKVNFDEVKRLSEVFSVGDLAKMPLERFSNNFIVQFILSIKDRLEDIGLSSIDNKELLEKGLKPVLHDNTYNWNYPTFDSELYIELALVKDETDTDSMIFSFGYGADVRAGYTIPYLIRDFGLEDFSEHMINTYKLIKYKGKEISLPNHDESIVDILEDEGFDEADIQQIKDNLYIGCVSEIHEIEGLV